MTVALVFLFFAGCYRSNSGINVDTDRDGQAGDTDADADTDTDIDTDTDADTGAKGIYQWHTFYGPIGVGWFTEIAADSEDKIFVTGESSESWKGPSGQEPLHEFTGSGGEDSFYPYTDVFILKLDSSGDYEWHTFYGAFLQYNSGYVAGMALDSEDNVYATGYNSSKSWEGPSGQKPLHEFSENDDIFILKLDRNGEYKWHTFYSAGFVSSIILDSEDNIYVAGRTYESWEGPEGQEPLHEFSGYHYADLFILKMDRNGGYKWHTFYSADLASSIILDSEDNIYVAGMTYESWEGSSGKKPLHDFSGGHGDLFVLKLDKTGEYEWHTFFGSGNDNDNYALSIALDSEDNIYATGYSTESWRGPAGNKPLHEFSGGSDIFILKLDSSGEYKWHSFYGSPLGESARSITLDQGGNIYMAGDGNESWIGPSGQEPLHEFNTEGTENMSLNILLLSLSPDGYYQWHTFYGSADADYGLSIAMDSNNNVYAAGNSREYWQGPSGQEPLNAYSIGGDEDSNDLFILKLK